MTQRVRRGMRRLRDELARRRPRPPGTGGAVPAFEAPIGG
jgi:hypothetical protein